MKKRNVGYTLLLICDVLKIINKLMNSSLSRKPTKIIPMNVYFKTCFWNMIVCYFRLQPSLHFIDWNQEGWKTGLCSVAPVGHPYSLLTLANNTCVRKSFGEIKDRFNKLYKRKVRLCILSLQKFQVTTCAQYKLEKKFFETKK